jgi:DNA-binding LytR/AlgR family response regulator
MAKKVKKIKPKNPELERYKKRVAKKLQELQPVFASASIGDFSFDVKIPSKADEFSELYASVQIMIDVIREKISMLEEVNSSLQKKMEQLHPGQHEEVFIGTKGRLIKINTSEIVFVKALGDYVMIHTHNDRHLVHSTMKGMMDKLSDEEFHRIHHSYIVRVDKISDMQGSTVLVHGKPLPVSRSNRKELVTRLKSIAGTNVN